MRGCPGSNSGMSSAGWGMSNRTSMIYRAIVHREIPSGVIDELGLPETYDLRVHSGLACFIVPTTGDLSFTSGRAAEIVSHRGLVEFDADIEVEDRFFVYTKAASILWQNLRVLAVLLDPGQHKQLDLQEVG